MSVDLLTNLVAAGMPVLTQIASNPASIFLQIFEEEPDDFDPELIDDEGYRTLHTLNGKWLFDKSDIEPTHRLDIGNRGNHLLQSFDTSSEMHTAMETATHVKIGTARHIIRREDVTRPTPTDPVWEIYCDHEFI